MTNVFTETSDGFPKELEYLQPEVLHNLLDFLGKRKNGIVVTINYLSEEQYCKRLYTWGQKVSNVDNKSMFRKLHALKLDTGDSLRAIEAKAILNINNVYCAKEISWAQLTKQMVEVVSVIDEENDLFPYNWFHVEVDSVMNAATVLTFKA